MKKFSYVIRDAAGIHARPAGMLVKEVKKYESSITILKDGKSVEATKIIAIMGMDIKYGQMVVIRKNDSQVRRKKIEDVESEIRRVEKAGEQAKERRAKKNRGL